LILTAVPRFIEFFGLLGSDFQIASLLPTFENAIVDRFDNLGVRCP
jgi:hypothetical protein